MIRVIRARLVLSILICAMGTSLALAGPDGSIDLFNVSINPDGTTGAVDFGACQGSPTVIFDVVSKFAIAVYARLSGPTTAGMSGAEFYVDGLETTQLPPGWTKTTTLAPGLMVVGDIDDPHFGGPTGTDPVRRVNVTWTVDGPTDPDCQKNALVFLARIELQSPVGDLSFPVNHYVAVVHGRPIGAPVQNCPRLVLCDFPIFDTLCATGGKFILNPDGSRDCTVSVAEETWSRVKQLYRDATR